MANADRCKVIHLLGYSNAKADYVRTVRCNHSYCLCPLNHQCLGAGDYVLLTYATPTVVT